LPSSHLPIETSQVSTTFLRIFAVNVLLGFGFLLVANLFRAGDTRLGYLAVMAHSVIYSILLSTDSFGIPAPPRFAPH
jgi:hypothetical protein